MKTEKQDPFADIRNKRMSELNEEQIDRATELWLRQNIGPSEQYWYSLLQSVFRVINRLRAERDAAVEDAERYRWLRDRAEFLREWDATEEAERDFLKRQLDLFSPEQWDACIG